MLDLACRDRFGIRLGKSGQSAVGPCSDGKCNCAVIAAQEITMGVSRRSLPWINPALRGRIVTAAISVRELPGDLGGDVLRPH